MGEGPLDVLVIGGGIVGAAVAWDASTRGLRTGLVERGDFAGGTSGKTSRMVHGGLRYLRDGRVGLVRRAVRERDLLIRNAPALVRPVRFTIPVYRGKPPGVVALRAGLLVYDLLSGGKALPRRAWMSAKETLEREPGIRSDGLEAAAIYSDATTDDVRLVLAVVQAAADAGALVANHAEVAGLRREAGRVVGATVRDWVRRTDLDIRSTVVVNATGVWIDRLRGPRAPTTVRPTKGVHVIVPRTRLGNRDAVTFHAPQDGRTMFIVPWGPLAVVGTTDTDYAGDWDHVVPSSKDVAYILESLNAAFPRAALRPEDVVSAYAGLRPLIRPRRSPTAESDISRAHRITEDPDGLLSVAGGKLTTMRLIAEDVVDRVCRRLGHRAASVTASRHLGPSAGDADAFLAMGFDPEKAAHLATRHRPEAIRPWTGEPNARERIDPGLPYVWVEVAAAVESEMAMTLVDVMVRRIGLFYEATGQGILVARDVAERMAAHLDWDAERIGIEVDDYARLVEDHRSFLRDTTQWAEVASWADSQPAGARKGG
jgi:glycerol-3-phosphate dehydrogenase